MAYQVEMKAMHAGAFLERASQPVPRELGSAREKRVHKLALLYCGAAARAPRVVVWHTSVAAGGTSMKQVSGHCIKK